MAEPTEPPTERDYLLNRDNRSSSLTRHQTKDSLEATNQEPETWTAEYRLIMSYSLPLIGTYLLQYLFPCVVVFVASRLSTHELAGVSIGSTTSNIIGYAVFEGMATALDTLCSQAWGAGQPRMVGTHCVKFVIFIHLVAAPIAVLWALSPQILGVVLPSRELAAQAGTFLRLSIVGIPGYAIFEAGKRFMQAQGNFNAGLVVLVLCLPFSAGFNWLFVFHLEMRVAGAALAAALVNAVRPVLLVGYVLLWDRKSLQCWPTTLDRQMLKNWGPMVRMSIPGALMTLSEWLSFEILTFATSYVSTAELAAQTFLSVTMLLVWHIPFSTSVAISTRIGHLMGAGMIGNARKVAGWYTCMFVAFGLLNMVLVVALIAGEVRYLHMDEDVRAAVAGAALYVAFFCLFDSTSSWAHGVIRGLGWQNIGGWITMGVNYFFAVPLSLGLLLGPANMGVRAVYLGLGIGLGVMTVLEGLAIKYRKWERRDDADLEA